MGVEGGSRDRDEGERVTDQHKLLNSIGTER